MKLIDVKLIEEIEQRSNEFMASMKDKHLKLDSIVILAKSGDSLITFGSGSDAVTKAVIHVAHKFHNEGKIKF